MFCGVRVTVGWPQKRKHASGDSGGEIARRIVCYDAAVGPCHLSPGSLMLTQPLQSFGCILTEFPRQTVLHTTSGKQDYVLQGERFLDYVVERTASLWGGGHRVSKERESIHSQPLTL